MVVVTAARAAKVKRTKASYLVLESSSVDSSSYDRSGGLDLVNCGMNELPELELSLAILLPSLLSVCLVRMALK